MLQDGVLQDGVHSCKDPAPLSAVGMTKVVAVAAADIRWAKEQMIPALVVPEQDQGNTDALAAAVVVAAEDTLTLSLFLTSVNLRMKINDTALDLARPL